MKILLPTIGTLLSLMTATTTAYACAAPRPFFYSLVAADAIVRGKLINYEVTTPDHARVTFEVFESLKGSIPTGRLSVNWNHHFQGEPRTMRDEAIVTLRKLSSQEGDKYEVMSGCMVQGIYWTAADKKIAMKVLENHNR